MKLFKLSLIIFPLLFTFSLMAQTADEDTTFESDTQVPAYSGDEAMEMEQLEMERQEEQYDEEEYNMNVDPDAYEVDEEILQEEEQL